MSVKCKYDRNTDTNTVLKNTDVLIDGQNLDDFISELPGNREDSTEGDAENAIADAMQETESGTDTSAPDNAIEDSAMDYSAPEMEDMDKSEAAGTEENISDADDTVYAEYDDSADDMAEDISDDIPDENLSEDDVLPASTDEGGVFTPNTHWAVPESKTEQKKAGSWLQRFIHVPYYYVSPCPVCGSRKTGHFMKAYSERDAEWIFHESLRNGELTVVLDEIPEENAFCDECGHTWTERIRMRWFSLAQIRNEKLARGTSVLLKSEMEKVEEERRHKSFIRRFLGV